MSRGRALLFSVILSLLPGLASCGRTSKDGPEALDGLPKGNPARPEPKGYKGVEDLRRALPNVNVDRERGPAMVKKEPSFCVVNNWSDHPEIQKAIPWETAPKPEIQSGYVVFQATVDGAKWAIRMNDFPEEPLYTLVIEARVTIHFNNWPKFWKRPESPKQ
jgi:hypothetical protein